MWPFGVVCLLNPLAQYYTEPTTRSLDFTEIPTLTSIVFRCLPLYTSVENSKDVRVNIRWEVLRMRFGIKN